jgi:hypothetical protein
LARKSAEKHVGAECVEPGKNIFGSGFSHQTRKR